MGSTSKHDKFISLPTRRTFSMFARYLSFSQILMLSFGMILTGCRRNETDGYVNNANDFLSKLSAARTQYDGDSSVDNLRHYQNVLHSLPGASNWPCVVTSVNAPNLRDPAPTVTLHGVCNGMKIGLTDFKTSRDRSTAVFDFLTNAKPGQTVYFTGVLDVGLIQSWDHPDPPPSELTFAVSAVR